MPTHDNGSEDVTRRIPKVLSLAIALRMVTGSVGPTVLSSAGSRHAGHVSSMIAMLGKVVLPHGDVATQRQSPARRSRVLGPVRVGFPDV